MITGGSEGVDYAFPPRPAPSSLRAAGKLFAVRYGGPGSSDKQLDPAEAEALTAAGLGIVANAEGSASGLLGGFSVGASWARTALAHFRTCGMPGSRPIYLSVDFNCTASQWAAVADALRGAASEIGPAMVGVYGHYNAVRWARRDGVAAWFWQTYAWSGGNWAAGNHLEQYHNGVVIDGADCDLNRATPGDYGQWSVGGIGGETLFSQKQGVTAADPATGEIYPSKGAGTMLMQKRVNRCPEVTPKLSEDGGHGPKTAVGLGQAVGGDGTYYGPAQADALDARLRQLEGAGIPGPQGPAGPTGPQGPEGPAGPTPTRVRLNMEADVLPVEQP